MTPCFSGLTMRTVLRSLPPAVLMHTQAFCLRAGSIASQYQGAVPHYDWLCSPGSYSGGGELYQRHRSGPAGGDQACWPTILGILRASNLDARLVSGLCRGGHKPVPQIAHSINTPDGAKLTGGIWHKRQ